MTVDKSSFKRFNGAFEWHFRLTKMTQKELAKSLGRTESAVRGWLEGQYKPSEQILLEAIKIFQNKESFEKGKELEQVLRTQLLF